MAEGPADTEIYRALGMPEPEGWADAAASTGIEGVARATLLRAFADIAVSTAARPEGALADSLGERSAAAAARFATLDEGDRRAIAGAIAWSVLQDVCALLSGATEPETNPGEVAFGVFTEDDDEVPGEKLQVLHEDWRAVGAAFLGEEIVAS